MQPPRFSEGYTHPFALMCKTYRGDLERCVRMVQSLAGFNPEGLPCFIVVTSEDVALFQQRLAGFVKRYPWLHLLTDADVCPDDLLTTPLPGYELGYANQQVVKLCFFKTGRAAHYLCVDADGVFIRPIGLSDFFSEAGLPYTVMYQGKHNALEMESRGYDHHFQGWLRTIQNAYGMEDKRFVSCSGFTLLSSEFLSTWNTEFLQARSYTVGDVLRQAPVEFSWYTQWILHRHAGQFLPVEPFFKIFHYKRQYQASRRALVRRVDIASRYIGLCLNSNWNPPSEYQNPSPVAVGWYVLRKRLVRRFHKIFRGFYGKK
jgi:Family of unknown function (DUF6492)